MVSEAGTLGAVLREIGTVLEACASAHHWARELRKLGHDARLMPPSYVKPYAKRRKNDTADAEAICEAVGPPTMRFVVECRPRRAIACRCLPISAIGERTNLLIF